MKPLQKFIAALALTTLAIACIAILHVRHAAPTNGRTIAGHIDLPPELAYHSWLGTGRLEPRISLPHFDPPENFASMTPPERLNWFNHWTQTGEGKRATDERLQLIDAKRNHAQFAQDNAFKLENVPPGNYALTVRFYEKAPDGTDRGAPLAAAAYPFIVSADPANPNATLDLGTLVPQPIGLLNNNQPVPDFLFPASDGKTLSLSQFKGKLILLDIWGVWCPDCHRDLPDLQKIFAAHGRNPNFAMISLSIDDSEETWKKFLAGNNMPWTQGILGKRDDAWQAKLLEVTEYPTYWLIGPDGKVLANVYRADELAPFLSAALPEKP